MFKKKKWFVFSLVFLVTVALLAGCGDNGANNENNDPADNGNDTEAAFPMTFVDDFGDSVEINEEPQRIISLMPNLTETFFALGLGERVVGVTDLCNYPAEVLEIDKVGSAWSLNTEVIMALEPDLVVTSEGTTQEEALNFLRNNGVTVAVVNPLSLDEIEESFRRIGKITGVPARGEELAADVRADRDAFMDKVAAQEENPTVFFMIDEELYTVGDGVFMNDLITLAGGVNAAAEYGQSWFQISEEILLEMNPEVIISTFVNADDILNNSAWQAVSAVENGRVFNIDDDVVSRPGPRIVEGLEELYSAFFE